MALVRPFVSLFHHRFLLWNLVRRDWQGKYRGSALGSLWSLMVPFSLVVIYTVFFAGIMRVRARADSSPADFALFLMCGSIPWWSFSESLTRSASAVTEQRNLVKKVVFPLDLLPASVSLSGTISEVIGLATLIVAVLVLKGQVTPALLLLPVLITLRVVFTTGLAWLFGSLGVFFRDIAQLLGVLLTAWMFLTPIFYEADTVPLELRWLTDNNPMTWLVTSYRSVLLDGALPRMELVMAFAVAALLVAVAGHYWFYRTSRVFADVV